MVVSEGLTLLCVEIITFDYVSILVQTKVSNVTVLLNNKSPLISKRRVCLLVVKGGLLSEGLVSGGLTSTPDVWWVWKGFPNIVIIAGWQNCPLKKNNVHF